MNDIFKPAGLPNTNNKTSFLKLNQTLRENSYLTPNIWNSLPNSLKSSWAHLYLFFDRMKNGESYMYSYFLLDIIITIVLIFTVIIKIFIIFITTAATVNFITVIVNIIVIIFIIIIITLITNKNT